MLNDHINYKKYQIEEKILKNFTFSKIKSKLRFVQKRRFARKGEREEKGEEMAAEKDERQRERAKLNEEEMDDW